MSEIDFIENELIIEKAIFEQKVNHYIAILSPQKIVDDAINSCRNKAIHDLNELERLTKDILITISKSKNISTKQKQVLVRFLINRNTPGYELISY